MIYLSPSFITWNASLKVFSDPLNPVQCDAGKDDTPKKCNVSHTSLCSRTCKQRWRGEIFSVEEFKIEWYACGHIWTGRNCHVEKSQGLKSNTMLWRNSRSQGEFFFVGGLQIDQIYNYRVFCQNHSIGQHHFWRQCATSQWLKWLRCKVISIIQADKTISSFRIVVLICYKSTTQNYAEIWCFQTFSTYSLHVIWIFMTMDTLSLCIICFQFPQIDFGNGDIIALTS